ncbi:hypothetical protein BN903_2 [Halorubrum sp. AJ67]|nr:hypothetical protein BN903_2 [Halorubrum sp. AJ67]
MKTPWVGGIIPGNILFQPRITRPDGDESGKQPSQSTPCVQAKRGPKHRGQRTDLRFVPFQTGRFRLYLSPVS